MHTQAKAQVSEVDAALSACAEEWASARAALRRDMEAHSEEAVKKVKAAAAAAAPAPNKSRAAALATLQQMLAAGMA